MGTELLCTVVSKGLLEVLVGIFNENLKKALTKFKTSKLCNRDARYKSGSNESLWRYDHSNYPRWRPAANVEPEIAPFDPPTLKTLP